MQRFPDSRYSLEVKPSVREEARLSEQMQRTLSGNAVSTPKEIAETLRKEGGYLRDNEPVYALALAINARERSP